MKPNAKAAPPTVDPAIDPFNRLRNQ